MANMCDNHLTASGSEQEIEALDDLISNTFGDEVYSSDIIGDEEIFELEVSFNSSGTFPREAFRNITNQLAPSDSLFIRVASDEPAMKYLEQSIFENGIWSFDNVETIDNNVSALREEALQLIRKNLSRIGSIYPSPEATFPAFYFDHDGYAATSAYDKIQMSGNSIVVELEDNATLTEDDLSIIHVIHILQLLKNVSNETDNP